MKSREYKSIKAWQLADDLAVAVYEVTKTLPREEIYGLTSQMRRAAVSVPANIVEGTARSSSKEYLHFLSIARGSLTELRYYVHLAERVGYFERGLTLKLEPQCDETARVLYGLMKSVDGNFERVGQRSGVLLKSGV